MNKISLAAALSILSLGGEVDLRGPVAQRVTIEPTPGWFWPGPVRPASSPHYRNQRQRRKRARIHRSHTRIQRGRCR